jgi:hypothetical protein
MWIVQQEWAARALKTAKMPCTASHLSLKAKMASIA